MEEKIDDILNSKDSIIVFDIDGVLAPYEFGKRNHNACNDDQWNIYIAQKNVYAEVRPLTVFQNYIGEHDLNRVFVCSKASSPIERNQKLNFVTKNYGILDSNVFFVDNKKDKVIFMNFIKQTIFPNLQDSHFIMVDDSVEVLNIVQKKSNFSTVHVSSFLDEVRTNEKIYGNFDDVYEKIKEEYLLGDVELVTYLKSISTPELTIEETYLLYGKLRYEIDNDSLIRVVENEVIVDFGH